MNKKLFNVIRVTNNKCCNELCNNKAQEEHTCPFAEEISEDFESLCTCCEQCTNNCVMDI